MSWKNFDLFLFDLDGLLVDTEKVHYNAYKTTCENCLGEGAFLWDFETYSQIAQSSPTALKENLLRDYPLLKQFEWTDLYKEKKETVVLSLKNEPVGLMPGVEKLLDILQNEQKPRCVVTHSSKELVDPIRKKNPILNTIPHWITREDYKEPKPSPEGYLKGVEVASHYYGPISIERVIAFEDSAKGVQSILNAGIQPVLVNTGKHDGLTALRGNSKVRSFETFDEVLTDMFIPSQSTSLSINSPCEQ